MLFHIRSPCGFVRKCCDVRVSSRYVASLWERWLLTFLDRVADVQLDNLRYVYPVNVHNADIMFSLLLLVPLQIAGLKFFANIRTTPNRPHRLKASSVANRGPSARLASPVLMMQGYGAYSAFFCALFVSMTLMHSEQSCFPQTPPVILMFQINALKFLRGSGPHTSSISGTIQV